MPVYREVSPPQSLARAVECFWTMEPSDKGATHRVVPDGCVDILFSHARDGETSLTVIGAMTQFQDHALPTRQLMMGVRFRPGMCVQQLGTPADRLTDSTTPLQDLWGARASLLLDQLGHAESDDERVALLVEVLSPDSTLHPVEHALAYMEQQHGQVSLDWIASQAGLSTRQFRRVCLETAGLSPKLLTRVLRFRHAMSRLRSSAKDQAGLAAECGYTDQSHFIAECKRFAGRTPVEYFRASYLRTSA